MTDRAPRPNPYSSPETAIPDLHRLVVVFDSAQRASKESNLDTKRDGRTREAVAWRTVKTASAAHDELARLRRAPTEVITAITHHLTDHASAHPRGTITLAVALSEIQRQRASRLV